MTAVVGYRLANWDTPLWASPNRRESRYGRPGSVVQYWSLYPLAPWAEQLRFHDMRDPVEARELLQRPWAAQLTFPDDVLEISFDNAAAVGLDPAALVDDDWSACQQWVAEVDASAMVVPSAALPGTENLVIFGPRVRVSYGADPFDPSVDVPCDPVADLSIVPPGLFHFVRWRGAAHEGHVAWAAGRPAPQPPIVMVNTAM